MIPIESVASGVEICIKCVEYIAERVRNYKAADVEVEERIAIVENCWTRTRLQVDFIRPLALILDPEHLRILEDVLGILARKLSAAVAKLRVVLEKEDKTILGLRPGFLNLTKGVRKGKYALVKEILDLVISDLEQWQKRFDPSWFLIMRVADPVIDEQLRQVPRQEKISSQLRPATPQVSSPQSFLVPGSGISSREPSSGTDSQPEQPPQIQNSAAAAAFELQDSPSPFVLAEGVRAAIRRNGPRQSIFLPHVSFDYVPIPYASAKAARRGTSWYIVESRVCLPGMQQTMIEDVRGLAEKLSRVDPFTFGLLSCRGAIQITDQRQTSRITSFDLVFRIPKGMEIPQTLRQALIIYPAHSIMAPSVTRRVRIARELAKSVSYVHTFNFIHKNITPETILLMEDTESSRSATFLIGFNCFRSAGGVTLLQNNDEWYRDIYRHPTRQGEHPIESYRMQHDIYSLGTCLLEIGLWEPLVDYPLDAPVPGRLLQELAGKKVSCGDTGSDRNKRAKPMAYDTKAILKQLAREFLPQAMGEMYTEIVLSCLTCLDDDNDNFGSGEGQQSADGPEGILLGLQFNEFVLGRLTELVV